jgi:ABC-type nitrate/sulfonate/bicarbonate transport system substrate-binding protein
MLLGRKPRAQTVVVFDYRTVKAAIDLTTIAPRRLIHVDGSKAIMIRVVSGLFLLVLFNLPTTTAAQDKFIASYAGFAGFQAPLWAAKDFGFMAKYGVNTDLVMIPGSARGAQAMLGGSIHFGQIDGTALISAINQGADLVFVASSLNKFPFSLVAQKNIRQPKDLVGKKVGIVAFGGAHEVSLILALKEWNIPRQSVTLLATGPAANRLLALSSGAHGFGDARAHDRAQSRLLSDERDCHAAFLSR